MQEYKTILTEKEFDWSDELNTHVGRYTVKIDKKSARVWYNKYHHPITKMMINYFFDRGIYIAIGYATLGKSAMHQLGQQVSWMLLVLSSFYAVWVNYLLWLAGNVYGGILKPIYMVIRGINPEDPLAEAQYAYVAVRHEMQATNPEWCVSIETKLEEGYRTPYSEKVNEVIEYVKLAIDTYHATNFNPPLPEFRNLHEIDAFFEKHMKKMFDESFQYYEGDYKDILIESVDNVLTGQPSKTIFIIGPPGSGKTYGVHSLKKITESSLGGTVAQLKIAGATVAEFIGTDKDPGILVKAYVEAYRSTKMAVAIQFFDEGDKVIGDASKNGGDIGTYLLTLIDTTNRDKMLLNYFNVHIKSPVIRIIAANKPSASLEESMLWQALIDRCEEVKVNGYSPDNKVRMALEIYLPKICKTLNVNTKELTKEDYKAIERKIREIKEPGARKVEQTVYRYIRIRHRTRKPKKPVSPKSENKPKSSFFSRMVRAN